MFIKSYYILNENSGNIMYDYYNNNNLDYKNDMPNNIFESIKLKNGWMENEGYLFDYKKKDYFYKKLKSKYIGSFTFALKLLIKDINVYQSEKFYNIFDTNISDENLGFGIVLKKIRSNQFKYYIKIDNLKNNYNYYEIHNFNNEIENKDHYIFIIWNEDTMDLDTYFINDTISDANEISKNKKNYSYNLYNEYYNGYLPTYDKLEIYSISIENLILGSGYMKDSNFKKYIGNIKLLYIDTYLFTEEEIFNFVKYKKKIYNENFFNGSNYFEITNGFLLKDNTDSDNIYFKYKNIEETINLSEYYNYDDILKSKDNIFNGWIKYDYTKTNQFNSYLFSSNLNDYFVYNLEENNYYSYSITIWTKGKNIDTKSTILSIVIPFDNIEYKWGTIDLIIEKDNIGYIYYLEINARDNNFNCINDLKLIHNIGSRAGDFKWDHICICYNNILSYDNKYGIIKSYFNKDILNRTNPNIYLNLNENTNIYLGINSEKNKKFTGFISGIQLFNEYIEQVLVDRTYDDLENCYHPDTKILTEKGYIKIKNLKRGDLVYTLFNSYQKLARLIVTPAKKLYEDYIIFKKGCFGSNKPNDDLIITKGHPVYYNGDYYNPEDFVNSFEFNVEYINLNIQKVYHLQFEEHQLVNSNNIYTTSLPTNTSYLNLYLPKELYFNKEKFNKENIGKHYPPYFLHEEPIPLGKIIT